MGKGKRSKRPKNASSSHEELDEASIHNVIGLNQYGYLGETRLDLWAFLLWLGYPVEASHDHVALKRHAIRIYKYAEQTPNWVVCPGSSHGLL